MLIDDRYRLEEAVGHGGMGEVWRATDTVLGRSVAIKLLSPDRSDEKATARFTMEARTAGRLSHPNTVAVYDFGTAGDQLYLVMEYVDGHSLATETAASGPLDPERVADLGAQAASGLAAAHREGIVHRDIKPANLLLTDDGTLKIGDFGIARFADESSASLTGSGAVVGTTSYLAPERARGRVSGPPADLYALGCVLYELLTGEPPFRADTPAATLYQHVERAPAGVLEHRDDVPAPLAALVDSLLAKDPGRRPTAEQVADWLATPAWRTGQPPSPGNTAAAAERPAVVPVPLPPARDAGTSPQPTPEQDPADAPGSRRRYVLAGVAATVALAATTLGLAALTNDPETHPAHPPAAAGTRSRSAHARPAAPAPDPATRSSTDIVDAPAGSAPTEPVSAAPSTVGRTTASGSSSAPGTPPPTATASPSAPAGGSTSPTASGSPSPSGSSSASGTQSSSGTSSSSGPASGSAGLSMSGSSAPGGSSSAPASSGSGAPSTASTAPTAP